MTNRLVLVLALATAACRDDRPPRPTGAEAGQLNEAEDMLNSMGEEKGAAPTGAAPSDNRY